MRDALLFWVGDSSGWRWTISRTDSAVAPLR